MSLSEQVGVNGKRCVFHLVGPIQLSERIWVNGKEMLTYLGSPIIQTDMSLLNQLGLLVNPNV